MEHVSSKFARNISESFSRTQVERSRSLASEGGRGGRGSNIIHIATIFTALFFFVFLHNMLRKDVEQFGLSQAFVPLANVPQTWH